MTEPFDVQYATGRDLVRLITYAAESVSLGFDRWDEPYVRGPSLYFLVVAGVNANVYADPLGENTWPVERCRIVSEDLERFVEAARAVAFEKDGAIVVSADGTVHEQMVRVKSLAADGGEPGRRVETADWMGTKHLSAAEASVRDEVVATVTLSEEDGRVTRFEDGTFEDHRRDELGGPWRPVT
jgi:DNA integrity scanning protein DisA with diadenylate cyclase activity